MTNVGSFFCRQYLWKHKMEFCCLVTLNLPSWPVVLIKGQFQRVKNSFLVLAAPYVALFRTVTSTLGSGGLKWNCDWKVVCSIPRPRLGLACHLTLGKRANKLFLKLVQSFQFKNNLNIDFNFFNWLDFFAVYIFFKEYCLNPRFSSFFSDNPWGYQSVREIAFPISISWYWALKTLIHKL